MPILRNLKIYVLLKLFMVTMVIFVFQKVVFMVHNGSIGGSITLGDALAVVCHGMSLDMTVSAYTLVVPLLVLTASFFARINLRRVLTPYYVVVMTVINLIFVADTVMYGFWHFKLDTTVFLYTDKPADALASVSPWFAAAAALVFITCSVMSVILIYMVLPKEPLPTPGSRWRAMWMLPLAPLLFVMIRGGVGDGTANVSKSYFSDRQFLNHSAVNATFNMLYSMAHQQDFGSEFHVFDSSRMKTLTAGIYHTDSTESDSLLNTRTPNILMIVWEGCGGTIAGCTGATADATPNLDRLARQGVFFSNCHANSFRTDRGLVSINSGWLGLPTASLMKIPSKCEALPGIAKTLREHGYATDFWYGGDISFTNMGGYMLQNGFQRTYSDRNFSSSQRSSNWGVPDEILLRKVFEDISRRNSGKPWFTEIMTLSSHEPWDVPYSRLSRKIENSFAYADSCIADFIERLRHTPQWRNTLVIIVPDHGVLSQPTLSLSSYDVVHIPLVFTGGAVMRQREIGTLMNQSDIAATLLGQMQLPHDDFTFSRDVMSKSYTTHTAIHTSKVEMTFHDDEGYTTIDLTSGKAIANKGSGKLPRTERGRAVLQMLYEHTAGL